VTFAGTGRFTGTMTAITAQVPEPSSVLLIGLGLLGLMFARKRQAV
jgi:threonine dehydrogenase-like Zn-dependent dehydrogenase